MRSDDKGARLTLEALPSGATLIADRGSGSNWFRGYSCWEEHHVLHSPTRNCNVPIAYDKALYGQRHKVENMFGNPKDWCRVAARYDRCAHSFFSAICIAAAVAFYLN